MSEPQRVVRLSAASLAVVLCRDPDSACAVPDGQHVFMDFKSQNLRSFWNKRLVKAVAEVYFQGWMENSVLLVQGDGSSVDVLREAWMRRALRSPTGFTIRAVGDLSPVQMSLISQSQFIPLSEVLCSVISDMNASHVMVNQEALINHMIKAHPGMTVPTQDILYNALGTLIKERKIYHTGEGYFIVTPQTYFITNSMQKEKSWWTTSDGDGPSPPPVTYLVSNESCLDASIEVPIMAHCKSCNCFTPQTTAPPSVQDQSISMSECTGKNLKWPKDHKPAVQNQSTSTAADYQASEISKSTTTSRKDKEKPGRKFGLNLFRRNTGKKENKLKKEFATFSGQFPPEEWPVRDEDDLNNLPRDLEHAIIKRINPELTVDNLVRHTVLMKKLDEKAERVTKTLTTDKGMSTEVLVSKQRHHSSKAGGKRSAHKATRSKRRSALSKEKNTRTKNKDVPCGDDLHGDDLRPELCPEEPDDHEDCADLEAKCVYKKRIENPFQSSPGRDTVAAISHKEQRRREVKTASRRERAGYRSKSWDPQHGKGPTEEVEKPTERSCDQLHQTELNLASTIDMNPTEELSGDYSSVYPKSSTLRIEDKVKLRDNKVRGREPRDRRGKDIKYKVVQERDLKMSDQKQVVGLTSHQYETTELPVLWPKTKARHRLSLRIVNSKEESDHCPDLLSSHQQTGSTVSSQPLGDAACMRRDAGHADSEVYTDDEHSIYQKVKDEEEEDGCSSLCLNEEFVSDVVHPSTARCREPVCLDGNWDSAFMEANTSALPRDPECTQRQHDYRWQPTEHQHTTSHLPTEPDPTQKAQCLNERLNEPSPRYCDSTKDLNSSIFDYCRTSERDSDAETVLKSVDETDGQPRIWTSHSQGKDYNLCQSEVSRDDDRICTNVIHGNNTGVCLGETAESQSNTADSGIDSPRTRMSLTSSNSAILKGLKRRGLLQNLEKLHSKSNGLHPQSSLLQLTPVMNV
ncbi:storkhead-box protein 1 [Brachyhypopomus gauderio]|uniref:storkhead-box protein 1 n=1 Tax=Brachyhypopomus gauderio TaxID=698409 RepID=UPI004041B38A